MEKYIIDTCTWIEFFHERNGVKEHVDVMDPDPYEISPSGDPFFADSCNVKAVKDDISKAHSPQAEFTRLESKEDIMSMINAL